jgi:hypothetical protein
MSSWISEDWNICGAVIFVVVPFVYCNFHASTYTNMRLYALSLSLSLSHTHTHMRVMSSAGMLYKMNFFFRWRKSCQKYVKGTSYENGHCEEVGFQGEAYLWIVTHMQVKLDIPQAESWKTVILLIVWFRISGGSNLLSASGLKS